MRERLPGSWELGVWDRGVAAACSVPVHGALWGGTGLREARCTLLRSSAKRNDEACLARGMPQDGHYKGTH
jgi:hypothetical protein